MPIFDDDNLLANDLDDIDLDRIDDNRLLEAFQREWQDDEIVASRGSAPIVDWQGR